MESERAHRHHRRRRLRLVSERRKNERVRENARVNLTRRNCCSNDEVGDGVCCKVCATIGVCACIARRLATAFSVMCKRILDVRCNLLAYSLQMRSVESLLAAAAAAATSDGGAPRCNALLRRCGQWPAQRLASDQSLAATTLAPAHLLPHICRIRWPPSQSRCD